MGKEDKDLSIPTRCLIVGNYCHDVLIKDDVVIAESLGGAASFISAVLDGFSIPSDYVSKVGPDFSYTVNHRPIIINSSKTTVFHAHFVQNKREDRVLKRVGSCDPIYPSDLPSTRFSFGLAVGVGGEILPETLEKMIGLCDVVFVDIQALIRVFDPVDGTVKLVHLNETGFSGLLKRVGFLKASAEEAPYVDLEEIRKCGCCVVVTNGKEGCSVYSNNDVLPVSPFPAFQVDPTGAGDSFLGGLVAGLVHGLEIPDAALLGNFFGSLTVGQIGLPKFDSRMVQRVKDEVLKRRLKCFESHERQEAEPRRLKPSDHEEFLAALNAAKVVPGHLIKECKWDLHSSPEELEQPVCNGHQRILLNPVCEEPINSVDSKTLNEDDGVVLHP